jgi:signal transduction histidine kinase/pSer/pThr/pTyr-binding forkhead associated (FHA) protein
MARLIVTSGQTREAEFELGAGAAVLGRAEECQVQIGGARCSRQHAVITAEDGAWFVEDLGSSNGTEVNGRRVSKVELRNGDTLTVGDCELVFVLDHVGPVKDVPVPMDESVPKVVETLDIRDPEATDPHADDYAAAASLRQHLQVLREVADTVCGELQIDRLTHATLGKLLQVYPQADHAHAVLLGCGDAGGDLCLSTSRPGQQGPGGGASRTLLEMATAERKAVLADSQADVRLQAAESIVSEGLRFMMCCPLVKGQSVLGAIQVDTADPFHPFTPADLQLLVTISGHVAVAAENARLYREAMARQRLAAIGEALSSIAHCIKNTLNAMAGGSYIIERAIKKEELPGIRKGWDMVKRNADFMTQLVKDILTYCRSGGLKREPADVQALLGETVAMVQDAAKQKGVTVALDGADELPAVSLDAVSMRRVVLNLLTNAVEACPEGSSVVVTARVAPGGEGVQISVADDGPGMPDDVRKRLFEPFFTTKGGKGTGLGLALVRKVMQEHAGRVRLDSAPGEGATFHLVLPVDAATADSGPAA